MGVNKVESCVCVVFGWVQYVSNSFISCFELNWIVCYWLGVLGRLRIDGKVIVVSMCIIGTVCSCLWSCGGRHYSALHPPGWLTVGGFALGGNGGAPDSEPVSAIRLSLSPGGTAGVASVVAGGVLFGLVVLGVLVVLLCLESLRGGLVMVVEVPVAKHCCFIKSWMAALMVAIWASNLFWVSSKLVWVSCIAVWVCCMWLS